MRAKIEVSNDGGETVAHHFHYQGPSASRNLSSIVRAKYPDVTDATVFRLVMQGGLRVCCWCQIQPEENCNVAQP